MDTHANLLLGLLAHRAGLIESEQFAEASRVCLGDPSTSMADWLGRRGWLAPGDRERVEARLDETLREHGGDARSCLDALAEGPARETLVTLGGLRDVGPTELAATGVGDSRCGTTIAHPGVLDGERFHRTRPHPDAEVNGNRDRYTLSSLHARGGIGQIWLARDEAIGREVALKELRPERAGDSVSWSRFVDEARITGQLEHPGIVPVYELVRPEFGGTPFYTMRFVGGRTFAVAIREHHQNRGSGREEPLGRLSLLNAFLTICHTVAYAHSRGVIHRDLKPQNVVLGDYGEVIVLDWGLAKVLDGPEEAEVPRPSPPVDAIRDATLHGAVLGTPAYMAPEQADGQLDLVDRRTDVYGLGAILYEILTGQPPFSGSDTEDLLRKVREQEPAAIRKLNPDAPKPLEAICRRAMSKRPEARYGSALDLAADIQRWIAHEPVSAYRERFGDWMRRHIRRHRTLAAVGLAVALTGAIALGVGAVVLQRERDRSEQQRRTLANYELALQALEEAQSVIAGHPAIVHIQAAPGQGTILRQVGPGAMAMQPPEGDSAGPAPRGMKKLDEIMKTQSLYLRLRSLLDTVGERGVLTPAPPGAAAPAAPMPAAVAPTPAPVAPMPAPVAPTPPEPPPDERLREIRRQFELKFRRQNPGVRVMIGD
jgi:tRNA A-37 threonylcarbamoyl transferase component Bud32